MSAEATEVPFVPAGSARSILQIEDLAVSFTGRLGLVAGLRGVEATHARAVDGVSFELREGEVLALAGESGCGKTTTARAIMGLIKPEAGRILYMGTPLGKRAPASTGARSRWCSRTRPAR